MKGVKVSCMANLISYRATRGIRLMKCITPFAERIQIARGPCWENDITFIVTTSTNREKTT
jgi:hypothetical protein